MEGAPQAESLELKAVRELSGSRTDPNREERGKRCKAGETGLRMAGEEREVEPSENGQNLGHTEQRGETSSRRQQEMVDSSVSWSLFVGI